MPVLAGPRMELWRRNELLPQLRRRIDRNQWMSSTLTAIEVEVWLPAATDPPSRVPTHMVQPQFQWGMPPPAAALRTITQSMGPTPGSGWINRH
jgi:hypothetical protein